MSITENQSLPTQRLSIQEVDPEAYKGMLAIEKYVHSGDLEPKTIHLLKIRASQLNGCAYCLDMHTTEARKDGEDQRRLDVVSAWREAKAWFSEPEQAVLEFTEQMTLLGRGGVSDEVWARVKASYTDSQVVRLLMAVSAINVWNRLAISTHQTLPAL
ncbi:carboxymuconolactone decarboxylase family protein [Rhodococcus sp. IEGM 1379]|uniref:carboxymuconolactone decarboxylase family protein n=1 Tax=Rhodococcus sp. IEGM 1379 TaxID=3047086 RepID=UPI0024B86A0A|nr:carboxymuconolactone decarboxylase family protein [Rhodococcus sp. IEGM 1379]MDI9918166.1 carboxymuconolactone decarboxylase family protein [Rhodococcus sp. IEGM 1379]